MFSLRNSAFWNFSALPVQGVLVQFLVGELRSHMTCDQQRGVFPLLYHAVLCPFPVNYSPKPPEAVLNSTKNSLSESLVVLEFYVNEIVLFGFFDSE